MDDVLVTRRGSVEFHNLITMLNEYNRNIFLIYKVDEQEMECLDLKIRKVGGNTLLHATSHHPWPLIRGIPYGQ